MSSSKESPFWYSMTELPPEVFQAWRKPKHAISPVAILATVDADGFPRTAPFGSLRAVTPRLLRLCSLRSHDTYANLVRDGRVSVALLAPLELAVSARGRTRIVKERMDHDPQFAILEIDIEEVKNDMAYRIVIESGITISAKEAYQPWYEAAMMEIGDAFYYFQHKPEIQAVFVEHAQAWKPLLVAHYGEQLAGMIAEEARRYHDELIQNIPFIGGEENPMTRHLVRSTTGLALYLAMKAQGKSAAQTGEILYQAVKNQVRRLPPDQPLTEEQLAQKREQAERSHLRLYPDDWVFDFIIGDGLDFDYGYDFIECGTQKLYHAYEAEEFLPFYCYLDFVTYRTPGWGFHRTMTLGERCDKCDFRFHKGWITQKGWPPPFLNQ